MFKKWYVIAVVYRPTSAQPLSMQLYRQRLTSAEVEYLDSRLKFKVFKGEVAIFRITAEDWLPAMDLSSLKSDNLPPVFFREELAVAA